MLFKLCKCRNNTLDVFVELRKLCALTLNNRGRSLGNEALVRKLLFNALGALLELFELSLKSCALLSVSMISESGKRIIAESVMI